VEGEKKYKIAYKGLYKEYIADQSKLLKLVV